MGFSRQEDWSGLPFPSPGDLPDPEIEPGSSASQADTLPSETPGKSQEYWSGLLCPPSGDLPNPGIKPMSPAVAGVFFTVEPPGKPKSSVLKSDSERKHWAV